MKVTKNTFWWYNKIFQGNLYMYQKIIHDFINKKGIWYKKVYSYITSIINELWNTSSKCKLRIKVRDISRGDNKHPTKVKKVILLELDT